MTWQTVVNVFAVIGAASVAVSFGIAAVSFALTRNADALNSHSSHR